MFHVGQKVVCVDDDFLGEKRLGYNIPGALPVKGAVYTIREIVEPIQGHTTKECLRLAEIRLPLDKLLPGQVEPAFAVRRFRPVVERKTDISVFTAMLTPAPKQKVKA